MADLKQVDVARRLDAVLRLQTNGLAPGETLLSACDAGPVSLLYKTRKRPVVLARLGLLGWAIHRSLEKRRAQDRSETILQSIAYNAQGPVAELPEAAKGCVLVLTNHRVIVYDRKVKQKLIDCPTTGVGVSANDHGLGKTSLVFSDGTERFVVVVDEGAKEMSRHFLASYPGATQTF